MSKRALNKSEKFKSMLDSAYELFERRGSHLVSIDEIVKKAGVAKGTFYLYFKDKYDLISKLILDKASKFMTAVEFEPCKIKNAGDFKIHTKNYIDFLIKFLEENRTLALLIDKNVNVCVEAVIENRTGPLKQLYDEIYNYFLALGGDGDTVGIRLYLYIDMVVSACCNAILYEKPYSLEQLKPQLLAIVGNSIDTEGDRN